MAKKTDAAATTPDYMAKLGEQLNNMTYTPKTDEQLRTQAENQYASAYDAKRLAAQQSYDTQALNYDQQMQSKRDDIAKSIERSNQQYLQSYNNNNRALQSRGMQRSSYGLASGANILNAGAKAAQDIQDAGDKELGNIGAQKALAGNQLAQTLQGLTDQQQSDILAYMDQLRDKDYERGQTAQSNATTLLSNLYQFQNSKEAADLAQKNFEIEFDAKYGKGAYANGGKAPRTGGGKTTGNDKDKAKGLDTSLMDNGFRMLHGSKVLNSMLNKTNTPAATVATKADDIWQ